MSIVVRLAMIQDLIFLFANSTTSQNAPGNRPDRPAPCWPDGRIDLNSPPGEKGLWDGGGRLAINPRGYEPNTTLRAPIHIDDVPLHPWARAVVDYRHSNFLKDEPYTRCKRSPGPRLWTTAYGFEMLDLRDGQHTYVLNNGGPHSFHTIYMDGRPHPVGQDLVPSYYGHSIGHWDGDTLVIDTVGLTNALDESRRFASHRPPPSH